LESCRISQGIKGVKSTRSTEYCVIIDVLRASSTIVTALAHGFREICTVTTIRDALRLRKKGYILTGERKGVTLPGFDLGNSPVEVVKAARRHIGKNMVLTTSNLTRTLAYCKSACICSSLNITAVSKHISGRAVNIVAVGGLHGIVEDFGVALALAMLVKGMKLEKSLIQKMITQSRAADHLTSIGFSGDVKFIRAVDKYNIVPVYKKGKIISTAKTQRAQRL
jgi:2-phosphosulfolactate phosphatase